ncbi:MAG: family 10 glycosylhydrolase [Parabacteroides sp.]|nr:family 10 glycosylhydrolase [Parabacteroides sp.]
MRRKLIGFILLLLIVNSVHFISAVEPIKKEIRGVWLTTVYGLDWPHQPATNSLTREKQQRDLIDILDRLQDANFNTVFLQVRLRGDVIWRSDIEPASKIFSGKYGLMPGYDPLTFVIEECHKRGMECHAWFVTFPLGTDKNVKEQGKRSVVKRHPKLCKRHNGEWYLDPGVPETSDYILSLVKEIVKGYDIDGIHFDYIRYPEQAKSFPDKVLYRKSGEKLSLSEWRRANINKMMSCIYDWVKSVKPWVQVSSAPLGKYNRIERVPNAGWTAYESVYQDPVLWMKQDKQDMIVPMMYYLHENFFPFMDNWVNNSNGRLVVPGLGAYRMLESEADWLLNDITDQIDYSRYYGGAGCAFFRCANVLNNIKGLYDELKNNYYKYPAQLPELTWLDQTIPHSPENVKVERIGTDLKIQWQKPVSENKELTYTVYYSLTDSIQIDNAKHILMTGIRDTAVYLPVDTTMEQGFLFSVSSSTRFHIESKPTKEIFYYSSKYVK